MFNRIMRAAIAASILLGIASSAPAKAADPILEVIAADGTKTDFDLDALKAMGETKISTETVWTKPGQKVVFTGVLLRDILKKTGLTGVETLSYHATNDYAVDIPTEDATSLDVILAYEQDGAPLDPSDKGPLWVMYPYSDHPEVNTKLYYSRAIWQLRKIVAQ